MIRTISNTHADPFEVTRERFLAVLPSHFRRLGWSADRLRTHRRRALRRLLRIATARSPWHAARLGPIADRIDEIDFGDLAELPVMTKDDMMDHYDEITTDARLTRDEVEAFLARAGDEPEALFDEFVILATGGSSGRRGVFALDLELLPDYLAGTLRAGLMRMGQGTVPSNLRLALVAAASPIHATRTSAALLDGSVGEVCFAPANLPIDEIVARLRRARPGVLAGYASVIAQLADEQGAGRLDIALSDVITTSETLTESIAARIESGFGVRPIDSFGTTEGLAGIAAPGSDTFTFASDLVHVEFVDEHERPVPTGTAAHHVLITNLVNTTQPLIRYRLDDRMTEVASPAAGGFVHATLDGRSDEMLRFGERCVHPHVVRSVLVQSPQIVQYRFRTRQRAIAVELVASGPIDCTGLAARIGIALADAGAGGVSVSISVVGELRRDAATGKLRQIVNEDNRIPVATPAGLTAPGEMPR